MMRVGVLAAAALGGALAAPVHARDMEAMRGHAVLRDFAKCTVKHEHELAKQVALGRLGPASMSEDELQRVFNARCLGLWGVRLRGTSLAMRAALAEELVRQDLGRWPELNPAALAPLTWSVPTTARAGPGAERLKPADVEKVLAVFAREGRVGRLGECVVRASPQGAVAVLDTKIDSQAELSALKALAPQVAVCVKSGETADFAGSSLRYAIGLSYYRLANAGSAPGASATVATVAKPSDDLSIQALHNFGSCVAERAPRGVRAALDLDYRSKEYDQQMLAVLKGTDYCLTPGGQMKASPMLYAGAMAEAMLKAEVPSAELPQRIAFDPARQVIPARSPVETMALCTALQAPQATAQLLQSEPTTKEETAAMSSVAPVLGDCLSKDTKLTLNQPALRAVLALAAWRIATTPKAAAQ